MDPSARTPVACLPLFAIMLLCAQSRACAEAYGNFETMGVIVDAPEGHKAEDIGQVQAFLIGENGSRARVHDLSRVGNLNHFATSLFWLKPDTEYKVAVEFYDKDGAKIADATVTGRTRAEVRLPEKSEKELYVGPTGDDAAAGTQDAPLKTLKQAFAKATAGTTIWVRAGRYYEGELAFAANGAPGKPIVVRACPKERAILDGADPAVASSEGWKDEGDGIYSHAYSGDCANGSIEHKTTGERIRSFPMGKLDELKTRKWNGKGFEQLHVRAAHCCAGGRIYVVLPGLKFEEYAFQASAQTHGIVLEKKEHLAFDGLEFCHYGKGDYGCVGFLQDTSNTLWQNCTMHMNNTGLWVKGACHNNTYQDNAFADDVAAWSWGLVKSGYDSHVETGCVYIEGKYSGRGMVIRRNKVSGTFDGVHLSPYVRIEGRTSETDFYGNTVTNIGDDFVETDGYSRNVRIFDNDMRGSMSGVSLAQALDGPTFVLYNTIADCGVCQGTREEGFEGYPFKTNGGPKPEVGSGDVFFYHNTAHTGDPKSGAMLVKKAKWRKIVLRNNVWCGRATGFVSWMKELSPLDWDCDDLYFEGDGGVLMTYGSKKHKDLDALRSATPWMKNGLSCDPKFADAPAGNYRLKPDSPLVDKGSPIPGVNDGRFKGKGPDIGRFESE